MELLYKKSLPFEYKMYKKISDIALSPSELEKIRNEFNLFFKQIQKSGTQDLDTEKLAREYEAISRHIKEAIMETGNKKSSHIREEVEFIFACCYLLNDRYGLSQKKMATIFGLREKHFSDWDIFPVRSREAFTKLEKEGSKKKLLLGNGDTAGIKIAEYLNRNVQAVHCCSGFIGITNDLDVFANISSTDDKSFILTIPLEFTDDDAASIRKANYAYARYVFALGNMLFDDEGQLQPAGCIRKEAEKLLDMQDISGMEYEGMFREIIASSRDLEPYMINKGDYDRFQRRRAEYQFAAETVRLAEEMADSGYSMAGVEYFYEHFGAVAKDGWFDEAELDEDEVKRDNKISTEELVAQCVKEARKKMELLEPQLMGYVNMKGLFRMDDSMKYLIQSVRRQTRENTIVTEPSFEARVRAAAGFWITEAFKDMETGGGNVKEARDYLKEGKLLSYIDALNAPPKGKKAEAGESADRNNHIRMIPDKGDILQELKKCTRERDFLEGKQKRPIMLYIDEEAHELNQQYIKRLQKVGNILIIVHDKDDKAEEYGMKRISGDLHLFM